MTWVRIADDLPDHPKLIEAGPTAGWLWLAGLCYANKYLTDGLIPAAQVKRLADVDDPAGLALQLVAVGLWEPSERGYRIHDYHDYQPSAEEIRHERALAAERQRAYRERKLAAQSDGVTDTATDGVTSPNAGRSRAARGNELGESRHAVTDAVSSGAPARPGPVNTSRPGTTPLTSPPLPPSPQAGKGDPRKTRRRSVREQQLAVPPEHAQRPEVPLVPLTDRDRDLWNRALAAMQSLMSELNHDELARLEPLGRAPDGGLWLTDPWRDQHTPLSRYQRVAARALLDAGDPCGGAVVILE